MDAYRIAYHPEWDRCFHTLERETQLRVFKKIQQLKGVVSARHLKHGNPCFVLNIGGNRVTYTQDAALGVRTVRFAGNHKDYLEWCQEQAEK